MSSRAPRITGIFGSSRPGGPFPRFRPLAVLFAFLAVGAFAASADLEPLSATLLTRDLGDFRSPGNAKIALALPESLARMAASAAAGDFHVYVYPEGLSEEAGTAGRYRAGGVYLWRFRSRLFLDVRELPPQDGPGPARVKIVFAPSGAPRAQGMAEGACRYTTGEADVVLAVDVSRSMTYNDPRKRRVAAARAFVDMAREGGGIGRVGLVTFNHVASVRTPLVPLSAADRIISDLARVGADGLTSLDAPLASALSLFGAGAENPVVILLTDGYNEGSFYQNTHRRCAAAGVRLFTVGLTESADHRLLTEMADATDGIYFRAPSDQDLPEIYARLAAELGKRYLMHADLLKTASGQMTLPVDGTVKRVVAMADGGARMRLAGPDGRDAGSGSASSAGRVGSVLVGRPGQGDCIVSWDGASPGRSAFALFGDTPFFLDVFPAQLQGGTFAAGATLALGAEPLKGGRVWLEPVPGIFPHPIELFDDGRHGDGEAGDGVYGNVIDLRDVDADRFDVTVRASGQAWDKGAFVRQTAGAAVRIPEEAEPVPKEAEPVPEEVDSGGRGPSLEGGVDFGVLYPGETGSAIVAASLDAPAPGEYVFALNWPESASGLPDFSSKVTIRPGSQRFDVEIAIPEDAVPGRYRGTFSILGDNGEVFDEREARVTVGAVTFADPGAVDLGVVRPGTTASRVVTLSSHADKAVALAVSAAGNPGLAVKPTAVGLDGGDNAISLEISISCPIDAPDDDWVGGVISLRAGPGALDIPVTWTVRAYSAEPLHESGLPEGLMEPPGSLAEPPPLDMSAGRDMSAFPVSGGDGGGRDKGSFEAADAGFDSPWERANRAIGRAFADITDSLPGSAGAPAAPAGGKGARGDNFWSAWWLYILAALLLLILLLLLLAYILYRLGSSAMVRFLLASIIINLILLAIFVALLGRSYSQPFEPSEMITVTFSEEGRERVVLEAGDSTMLAAGGGASFSPGDSDSEAGEAGQAPASGAASVLPAERSSATLVGGMAAAAELTLERAPGPVQREETRDDSPRRRDRLLERNLLERAELPENMPEPMRRREPADRDRAISRDRGTDTGERVDIEAETTPAVWKADQERREAAPGRRVPLLSEPTEVEMVELESTLAMTAARGRRRHADARARENPEPRVEINDPRRDAVGETQPIASTTVNDELFGVEEARLEMSSVGAVSTRTLARRDLTADRVGDSGQESDDSAKSSRPAPSVPEWREGVSDGMAAGEDAASGGTTRNTGGSSSGGRVGEQGGVNRPDVSGAFSLPSSNLSGSGDQGDRRGESDQGGQGDQGGQSDQGGQGEQGGQGGQGAFAGGDGQRGEGGTSWLRPVRRQARHRIIEASSMIDPDSLLIVVGDFSRLPDSAAENLFAALISRRTPGVTVEERRLAPDDPNLGGCLLALATAEEADNWPDESLRSVAAYLSGGGHIWIDAGDPGDAEAAMERLARAAGGTHGPLPASHQLSEKGQIIGLFIDDNLAAVATAWNWRREWRYDRAGNGAALRFLVRCLNFFLSGNADQGIEADDIAGEAGLWIASGGTAMPDEIIAPEQAGRGRVWQRFPSGAEADWGTASWGDPLALSTTGDGRGGRVLKLDFDSSNKGRMALTRILNPPEDLSRTGDLTADVYYDGSGAATMSLILTAPHGDAWADYESLPSTLRKGWNRLSFRLRNGFFRLMSGAGRDYDEEFSRADRLGRVGFMIYRKGEGPGMILIGDMSVHDD